MDGEVNAFEGTGLLTIVICTYNRNELLGLCLEELQSQVDSCPEATLMIIDNFGSSACRLLAAKYNATYHHEKQTGLSHARNRGWREATTAWVLYLDDDALPRPGLLTTLVAEIKNTNYCAIGGRFTHWFRTPPPRWLRLYYPPEGYRPSPENTPVVLPESAFLVGGIMAFSVKILREVNGFNSELGMKADTISRAEEDDLQFRLRRMGYQMYYNPDLVIHHLVQPYKYRMLNQIRLAYASGRDNALYSANGLQKLVDLCTGLLVIIIYKIPYETARFLLKPNYYWQNAFHSIATKTSFLLGKFNNRKL